MDRDIELKTYLVKFTMTLTSGPRTIKKEATSREHASNLFYHDNPRSFVLSVVEI